MTVHVYNPHVNIQDLITFLRRHCTVTIEPSRNLDSDGIWDGKWTVMVKLKEDPAAPDGIHHPSSSFSVGATQEEEQPENEGPDDKLDQVTKVLQEMRALASVMEASPPPSLGNSRAGRGLHGGGRAKPTRQPGGGRAQDQREV
ncbi:hypothetical protein NDU88_001370 [Pleurodeles waltl]|uniref:Zinc finger CCHC domain-containing protein n=1 Tax=Pleurodeles waltl TaxID=8319 RepID=A0AAV7SZ08_PLEWA|nr:hypothetical protein NDU88_001370 [Pleurodeles waltl]